MVRDLPATVWNRLLFEADLDHALERCEDMRIAEIQQDPASFREARAVLCWSASSTIWRSTWDRQVLFEELVELLEPWLERREYDAGDTLAACGTIQPGMQFLVTGRVSVHDAEGIRLLQCGPGEVIGRQAAFGAHPASTTTVAEEPCVTMMLIPLGRRLLESTEPGLGLKLYQFLMRYEPSTRPA